ncbi:hypothetical protein D3C81_1158040 [compost metagenome]
MRQRQPDDLGLPAGGGQQEGAVGVDVLVVHVRAGQHQHPRHFDVAALHGGQQRAAPAFVGCARGGARGQQARHHVLVADAGGGDQVAVERAQAFAAQRCARGAARPRGAGLAGGAGPGPGCQRLAALRGQQAAPDQQAHQAQHLIECLSAGAGGGARHGGSSWAQTVSRGRAGKGGMSSVRVPAVPALVAALSASAASSACRWRHSRPR